jgi:hypothetical protein
MYPEDKPRELSLFHTVTARFRLGSVYDNVLKNFISNGKNTQISRCALETRTKHISVKEVVTSAKSSLFHTLTT